MGQGNPAHPQDSGIAVVAHTDNSVWRDQAEWWPGSWLPVPASGSELPAAKESLAFIRRGGEI